VEESGDRDIARDRVITFATLCRLGLGDPWVAQGWPKRRPRVTQGPPKDRIQEVPLFAMKCKKGRVVGAQSAPIAEIARHRRDRKSKTLPLINKDDTDQNKVRRIHRRGRRCHTSLVIATIAEIQQSM
jgi:hypothetical protein